MSEERSAELCENPASTTSSSTKLTNRVTDTVYRTTADKHKGDGSNDPADPSTSKTNLDVSEDSREETEDEEYQLCPEDPDSLKQQQQLVCGDALKTNDTLSFTPELLTKSRKTSYRFKCPGPGVFQCALTGLVFVMAQEAELLYSTVPWDELVLQLAGKVAAGPLFKIQCSDDDAVCQLHFPHCETKEALLVDGLLSVVHITDDGMSFLKPLEITDTHVIVNVPQLAAFGLIWDYVKRFLKITQPIDAQVLLFLRPPDRWPRVLDVLLVPCNVPLHEVEEKQRGAKRVKVSSSCDLWFRQNYSVHCEPEGFEIQPKHEPFRSLYGPNYHPTFEIFLKTMPERLTVMVQDQKKTKVWEREVYLTGPRSNVSAEDDIPPEDWLLLIQKPFVNRVSEVVLNQLLDKLLERHVMNDEEMQTARIKARADKARDVIDTVRRKGTEASSALIAVLCEVDPLLSRELKLN